MSVSKESDAGFPWFEEQNFTGWLVQFRAHLCNVLVVRKSRNASLSPPAGQLHHLLRTGSRLLGGARQSKARGVMTNSRRVLSDGVIREEVTQVRSLRKVRFCL